ncbi:cyanide hydratase [Aspergillus lentulus]|nr:cyanide hydratase [Aspergillus lentulus]
MTTPVHRTSRRPPVKVACLACRASRIRCDGQEKCANCISRERICCYIPSKRGGARVPRTKRKSSSRQSSSSTIRTVGGKDEIPQESTPIAEGPWNSNNEDDLLDHFMSLGKPGAGLRSIESSVAEMEHIFDHIFGVENGNHLVPENDESVPDLLQVYGSDEDILDAYYVFIHLYYPILPPPERFPAYNRPLDENSPFRPSSPLSLAISAILVLIPHPGIKQPATPEDTRLRRNVAHSFAQSALQAVEADLELLDSSSDPSRALSDGAPMIARQPFHPKVPLSLEAILALVLLSVYEYAQRGNIRKMCNRAGQALAAAMNMSLHEMVEDDEYAEARRRAWWITYLTVCQGSIASGMPAAFNLYDPRFVTPYPEGWKLLIEAQQTILEATTFVHDLDQTVKSRFKASWISSRMTELDDQITTLLLLCRRSSLSTTVSPLDSPEKIVSQTINQIAEIKLHSARIKVHRFCAFSDVPIFRKRHCDLQPECCGAASAESAIPSPPEDIPLPSIMKSDHPDLTFPFSSHTSSKICLQSALNIVTLVDNLPYPNPDHTIPLTLPPYLSNASRVEIPRVMPTFACCVMQASYAMLMLYLKARAKHANSPEDSVSAKGLSLTGFLNELQQNLRLVSKILANYAIAAEALQGMKEEVSHWAFLDG